MSTFAVQQADALEFLRTQPQASVDLIFGSPPYEQARLYLEAGTDLRVSRKTEAWVSWMIEIYLASLRVCRGLVAFVVDGQTRKFKYSCGPALLMADLHRAGVCLRKPPIFHRVGIPGSGGTDWLRNDWEWIICATNGGKLPWSDNTACGHAPKWAPGGEMSHRLSNGARVNQWGTRVSEDGTPTSTEPQRDGTRKKVKKLPSHYIKRRAPTGVANGDMTHGESYDPPAIANPGNVIKLSVGGGLMGGDQFASQNEAPFPEALAAFFVQSFCPPGGVVCDPFSGSGTTGAVSVRHGRNFIGCDLRASQVELSRRRIEQETELALLGDS